MNMQKFNIVMNSLNDRFLEEAKQPIPKKNHLFRWVSVAACFFLMLFIPFLAPKSTVTAAELISQGYDILLPENIGNVSYYLHKNTQPEMAQAIFTFNGDKYTYEIIKTSQTDGIEDNTSSASVISWNSNGLDLTLSQNESITSVNWYSATHKTQHTLSSSAEAKELLGTTRQVLLLTGLDLADAPADATDVQYHVFSYQNLVVAETTFLYEGTLFNYRMAATPEVEENFVDISGIDHPFSNTVPNDVGYCRAKISFTPGQQGKIIWFDIVPGIVYSLTMDNNASEEMLLHLANSLFEPAQDDSE